MASFRFINQGCNSTLDSGGLLTLQVLYKGQTSSLPAGSPLATVFGGPPEAGAPYQVVLNRGDEAIASVSGRMTSSGITIIARPGPDGRCTITTKEGVSSTGTQQVVAIKQQNWSWLWWIVFLVALYFLVKYLARR